MNPILPEHSLSVKAGLPYQELLSDERLIFLRFQRIRRILLLWFRCLEPAIVLLLYLQEDSI